MSDVLKRFNKIFGISEDEKTEKLKFVNRINQSVFKYVEQQTGYESLSRNICYQLGINEVDLIRKLHGSTIYRTPKASRLRELTKDDFKETLKLLVLINQYYSDSESTGNELIKNNVSVYINNAIENSHLDLGILWKKGIFFRKGAKELDQKLISEPFDWIDDYPKQKEDFEKAIQNYLKKDYESVIRNCYNLLEGLCRKILNNKKVLKNNKNELFKKLGFSNQWAGFLSSFINYINEHGDRHASENIKLIPQEIEASLYLTGIFIRLITSIK